MKYKTKMRTFKTHDKTKYIQIWHSTTISYFTGIDWGLLTVNYTGTQMFFIVLKTLGTFIKSWLGCTNLQCRNVSNTDFYIHGYRVASLLRFVVPNLY